MTETGSEARPKAGWAGEKYWSKRILMRNPENTKDFFVKTGSEVRLQVGWVPQEEEEEEEEEKERVITVSWLVTLLLR